MSDPDFSAEAIAERVNCYGQGDWIASLAERAGMVLRPPLGSTRERAIFPLVRMGLSVSLFRRAAAAQNEDDQIVFHWVAFDPQRAALPFGLDAGTLTPESASRALSSDTAGGRSVDRRRGHLSISYFLSEDARAVELTFKPTMVGVTSCRVFRLGGEIAYSDLERLFGQRAMTASLRSRTPAPTHDDV